MIQVLVVEDDPMVMDLTCKYVESVTGFAVAATASNGADALEMMKKHEVDLVILDVFMPRMTGTDFLARLRAEHSLVDVIFLTAANNADTINTATALGIVDYLIKPFTYERFRSSLEKYARRRAILGQKGARTQEELDAALGTPSSDESARTTKGLHPVTLEKIRNYVNTCKDVTITQQEIADNLSLSRVTVRRYMDYLISTNEVAMNIEYGAVGRPSYSYRRMG